MSVTVDDGQLALDFSFGVFDEPDTLTKAEYVRYRYTLADPPPTWGGRPYQDVDVSGGRL
jgi:hypothetical protein